MTIEIHYVSKPPLVKPPTYIGVCCREWELAYGYTEKCGLCGTVPVFVRP